MLSIPSFLKRAASLSVLAVAAIGMSSAPAAAHYTARHCDRDGDQCYTVVCDDDGDNCQRVRRPRSSYSYGNGYGAGYGYGNGYNGYGYNNPGNSFGLSFGSPYYGNGESREHEEEENEEHNQGE